MTSVLSRSVPPIGSGSALTQVKHRDSKHQQKHRQPSDQKTDTAPESLPDSDHQESQTQDSSDEHKGADRYA